MLTIEGKYKNGQIILTENLIDVDEAKVLVTFLSIKEINLPERNINEEQAAELRAKLSPMTDNLITVLNSEIDSVLGSLLKMDKVESALCHTFGINISIKEKLEENGKSN